MLLKIEICIDLGGNMGKHAYLIMAHNQFEHLGKMLECLDNERNDFFIHIDKRSKCDFNEIKSHIKRGRIYFTNRIKVLWGGYSQIKTEMILLKAAVNNGVAYDYYHLITGVDFPLKPQKEILDYFDKAHNKEFISLEKGDIPESFMARIKFYYPGQDFFKSRKGVCAQAVRKITLLIQRFLHINRNKPCIHFGLGSAYFDITDEFARYVVNQDKFVKKHFKSTFCADEIFIQTLWLNWEKRDESRRYHFEGQDHQYIQNIYLDVNRAIDWTRGKPYVYKDNSDFDILIKSGCLFARKFDYAQYPEIVNKLYKKIKLPD